jgi:hypothetical protein
VLELRLKLSESEKQLLEATNKIQLLQLEIRDFQGKEHHVTPTFDDLQFPLSFG